MHLKAKDPLHTTQISNLKNVFVVFFETNQMLKYKFFKKNLSYFYKTFCDHNFIKLFIFILYYYVPTIYNDAIKTCFSDMKYTFTMHTDNSSRKHLIKITNYRF